MSCEDCRERLVLLLHDELEPDEARIVGAHVRDCDRCAIEYCRVHLDLNAVAAAHELAPPEHVRVALRARVAAHFAPRRWQRALGVLRRPVPAYGLAVAAMVPLLLWLGRPVEPATTSAEPAPLEAAPRPSARPELSGYDGTAAAPGVPVWM
jgi:anti-sigma factor RsiW